MDQARLQGPLEVLFDQVEENKVGAPLLPVSRRRPSKVTSSGVGPCVAPISRGAWEDVVGPSQCQFTSPVTRTLGWQ